MTDQVEQLQDQAPPAKVIRGYLDCPFCRPREVAATVMETKKPGKLYFNCPVHQVQLMTNQACQQWIHENMRDTPQRQPGDPEATPLPAPGAGPKKVEDGERKPKPRKDWLKDW